MADPGLVGELITRADPANLALLALVWWRLDRRLRLLERRIDRAGSERRDGSESDSPL